MVRSDPHEDAAQPGLGLQNLDGQTLPQSPHSKVAFNTTYTWRFSPGDLIASASLIYKDRSYDNLFDRAQYLAPSYNQVDARLTYNDRHDRFTVIALVKNLTNVNGYDNVGATFVQTPQAGGLPYNQQVALIQPRTYGLEFQYRFR